MGTRRKMDKEFRYCKSCKTQRVELSPIGIYCTECREEQAEITRARIKKMRKLSTRDRLTP